MVAAFTKKLFAPIRRWMGSALVADVPDDIAACEFECKRPECYDERFVGCERRKRAEELATKMGDADAAGKPSGTTTDLPAATPQRSTSLSA